MFATQHYYTVGLSCEAPLLKQTFMSRQTQAQ